MKLLKTLLLLIFTLKLSAQIKYEQGYIIDNNNQKKTVLIKNVDWLYNPKSFEYKINNESKTEIASLTNVKEFGINNEVRYIKANVDIDRSKQDYDNIDESSEPQFNNEELFLRVLVEGNANLYSYSENNLQKFFYSHDNTTIKQLVYKKYKTEHLKFAYNKSYRNQIITKFNCSSITKDRLQKVDYKQKHLISLFTDINNCLESNVSYKENQKNNKIDFNLYIRPRLNNSTIKLDSYERKIDISSKTNFSAGIEAEFILPFNKNKWSFILEPTYQYFKVDNFKIDAREDYGDKATIKYNTIEIPFGIRHYFFLNNKSKIYANAQFMFSLDLESNLKFYRQDLNYKTIDLNSRTNFVFGLGYNYNNKISAEIRLLTDRVVMDESNWNSKYNAISFIVGYNIF